MTTLRAASALCLLPLLIACAPSRAATQDPGVLSAPTILQGMEPDRDDLDLRTTPVVRAVQRAADSVVSIYVLDASAPNGASLESQGSGVIVDASGYVITNWHVVLRVERNPQIHRLQVRLKDDRRLEARLLTTSAEHDLALLQLVLKPGETVQPVVAGRSDSLMVGETVIAIGNPQGHANTVTVGVLSATDRSIRVAGPDGLLRDYTGLLQTDAAINQGNSGGALLDITGKLIGINNAMAVGVENIGFAIPVDTVKRVFDDVLAQAENLATVWIGAAVEKRDGNVVVSEVFPDGPAARADLEVGDRVVAIGDREVNSTLDFYGALAAAPLEKPVRVRVARGARTLDVTPLALSAGAREVVQRIGLEVDVLDADRDRDLLRQATYGFYQGQRGRFPLLPTALRVRHVYPGGTAAGIGVRDGDLLLGSAMRDFFGYRRNVPFRSLDDLADRTRDARSNGLFVIVMRDGEILEGELPVRAVR
ncbi:MAG: trypsin-like peptidase domain-containing protein [Planctomycetes bacterium]|nr:trypsin-like peptidase domain-containing protein [Planctomycetota bacterium]